MSRTLGTLRWFAAVVSSLALCTVVWSVAGAQHANDGSLGSDPQFAATEQEFQQEGQLAYADRPADVRAVMDTMYDNNSRYRSFSGLLVNHEPVTAAGSVWVNITQPGYVRTDAFSSTTGVGTPTEQTDGHDGTTTNYSPRANGYVVSSRPSPQPLQPLSAVPLSVVQVDYSATAISALAASQSIVANDFTHPAAFLTSPFFTDKKVVVSGNAVFDGRPCWILDGTQVTGTPIVPQLGDRWRVWVDKQTGIMLRREYYSGATMIGWAEFENVAIDGQGPAHQLPPLKMAAGARAMDPSSYGRMAAVSVATSTRRTTKR
jgi:hypothetical protein